MNFIHFNSGRLTRIRRSLKKGGVLAVHTRSYEVYFFLDIDFFILPCILSRSRKIATKRRPESGVDSYNRIQLEGGGGLNPGSLDGAFSFHYADSWSALDCLLTRRKHEETRKWYPAPPDFFALLFWYRGHGTLGLSVH